MTPTEQQAAALATYLSFPEVIALKGETWCQVHRMCLTFTIGSDTQEWTEESLTKQIATIKQSLEGAI